MLFLKQLTKTKTLIAILALISLSACSDKAPGPASEGQTRKPQVSVIDIEPTSQVMITTLQGRTAPYMVAEVRPQVGGILQKRLFDEGAEVKEGQPLYQIDPTVYEAQVASAKAELARAESVLYQSQLTAKRYAQLVKTELVSKQQNDDAQAAVRQAQAAVQAAKAQLKTAQINLDYTTIRSPIDGKAGRSLVTPGALLSGYQANNMVVVQTLDPIYVDVNQASGDLLKLKKELAEGKIKATKGEIPIQLILEDGTKYSLPGSLTLSEVSVDQGTGTLTLRAEFPNPDGLLLPGMFVRAELPQGVRENAILVPQRAVLRRTDGAPYVLVVENGVVAQKVIDTTETAGSNWVVESGLKPGDKVIIEGFQRIRPGVPVDVVPPLSQKTASSK
ncbi:efflux RND transporter periplasmic adaptor subunit [Turicimonas muris]|uniref:efflux RND transporter periplasmic adaptor subunit n=1 Tax=Turicimonas muris TaxID=1796652 RepID=UPI002620E99F|nr:efflux RND transporter periplasmic adaptor subunit [Turicimonas muris]